MLAQVKNIDLAVKEDPDFIGYLDASELEGLRGYKDFDKLILDKLGFIEELAK